MELSHRRRYPRKFFLSSIKDKNIRATPMNSRVEVSTAELDRCVGDDRQSPETSATTIADEAASLLFDLSSRGDYAEAAGSHVPYLPR